MEQEGKSVLLGFDGVGRPVYSSSSKRARDNIKFVKVAAVPAAPKLEPGWKPVIDQLPRPLQKIVAEVALDPATNKGIEATMGRKEAFRTPVAALLAGVALDPDGRSLFEARLDEEWAKRTSVPRDVQDEVVVGSGVHAAIYCAVRVLKGFPAPLVLEASDRVGGTFAVSRSPAFYLNSRNRPGPLSIPGEMGSLNFMPGALIQPSELGGAEYQTNDALAWVVRTTLAMFAKVVPGARVTSQYPERIRTYPYGDLIRLSLADNRSVRAKRVVWATGVGDPVDPTGFTKTNPRFLSFEQFMARMDDPYPLRGMGRVAVVGAGDGARTVIEALTGQGPTRGYSVAALDWPTQIDWYGCKYGSCDQWIANNRSRYKPIGALLPSTTEPNRPYRVRPLAKADSYSIGFDCAYVGDSPYDYVIVACGYGQRTPIPYGSLGGVQAGSRFAALGDGEGNQYVVGPAANLSVTGAEEVVLRGISENNTSIFRYAPRTAWLAETRE